MLLDEPQENTYCDPSGFLLLLFWTCNPTIACSSLCFIYLVVYLPTNQHSSRKSLSLCKHASRSDALEIELFLNESICFWNQQKQNAKQNWKKGAVTVDLIFFFPGNDMLMWYVRRGSAHMYIRELESLGFLAEVIHCVCDVLWQCCDYAVWLQRQTEKGDAHSGMEILYFSSGARDAIYFDNDNTKRQRQPRIWKERTHAHKHT